MQRFEESREVLDEGRGDLGKGEGVGEAMGEVILRTRLVPNAFAVVAELAESDLASGGKRTGGDEVEAGEEGAGDWSRGETTSGSRGWCI